MAVRHFDHFGNHIDIYRIDKPHTRFAIEVRAAVEVCFADPPPAAATPPWEEVRSALSGDGFPVPVEASDCTLPSTAQGYVFNATVIPQNGFHWLTLWPDGEQQPGVSTLNANDGRITSNMAIVPTTNGNVDAWAQGSTQLILDISGYFAP